MSKKTPHLHKKHHKRRTRPLIAYDLETSRIEAGTPTVKYITLRGDGFLESYQLDDLLDLARVLESRMLTPIHSGKRFVAWYGNSFDIYFIVLALIHHGRTAWHIKPYMTAKKMLRGLCVYHPTKEELRWEFIDGAAATGCMIKLKAFGKQFAPLYPKHSIDVINFDPTNETHIRYAERDAELLYHAMLEVESRLLSLTGNGLMATIGKAAILFLAKEMPPKVNVYPPPAPIAALIHKIVKRGGYVWIAQAGVFDTWKYDLNSAYPDVMGRQKFPCGSLVHIVGKVTKNLCGIYRVTFSRTQRDAQAVLSVPFYYKDLDGHAHYVTHGKFDSWLINPEIDFLMAQGWTVVVHEGWYWSDTFRFAAWKNKLEKIRITDPGGPKGPMGTICKILGNAGYGKTGEQRTGDDYVISMACPEGYTHYNHGTLGTDLELPLWVKSELPEPAFYHVPQIAAFVTAYVRIRTMQAALLSPDTFISADTDMVAFSSPVAASEAQTHPLEYGKWKKEVDGTPYIFVCKKGYADLRTGEKHIKGLVTDQVTVEQMQRWLKGELPVQVQTQRQGFLKVLSGEPMYKNLERTGTDIKKLKNIEINAKKQFFPKNSKKA